jgi:hypothetical protein
VHHEENNLTMTTIKSIDIQKPCNQSWLQMAKWNEINNIARQGTLPNNIVVAMVPAVGKVSGRIITADDCLPLPGVQVRIKGTNMSVVTNVHDQLPFPFRKRQYTAIDLLSLSNPGNTTGYFWKQPDPGCDAPL